jgi:tRNA-specific 2-thiouridylase
VVDLDGHELGRHRGAALYTVGQRTGLGDLSEPGPWYVIRVDIGANRLVVGRRGDLGALRVELEELRFVARNEPRRLRCSVRLRYRASPVPALYDRGTLELETPFLGAAPGQAAVLYEGTRVVGGGTIRAAA